jgi:transcriptional regulator with XRE-family HTH domain
MAITEEEVRQRLREAIERAGSQQAYAAQIGVSNSYLSDVVNGRRLPGESILRPLGLTKAYAERNRGGPEA